jgi:hypothetical protein
MHAIVGRREARLGPIHDRSLSQNLRTALNLTITITRTSASQPARLRRITTSGTKTKTPILIPQPVRAEHGSVRD